MMLQTAEPANIEAAEAHGSAHGSPPFGADPEMLRTLGLDAAGRWRRRIVRMVWLAALGGLLIAAVLGTRGLMTPKPVTYLTAPVTQGDLTLTVTATGTLQPLSQVEVGSDLSGRVTKVHVVWNQPVTVNQPLAELDTDLLTARVREAEAQLKLATASRHTADATVAEATASLGRIEPSKNPGIATDSDVDAARAVLARATAAVETADAQIASAQAALQVANTNLDNAIIRSPINGVVLDRNIEPGQSVVSSLQAAVLFTLAEDLRKMELYLDVDEADIGRVREEQTATFTVAAWPERVFRGRVASVRNSPVTTNNVVTYVAVLEVDNSDMALRPGMTATAAITTEVVEGATLVPNAALRFAPASTSGASGNTDAATGGDTGAAAEGARVWVLRDGVPVAVPVTIGANADGHTQIRSGEIRAGTQVIVRIDTSTSKKAATTK